jgi:hypothetical protein
MFSKYFTEIIFAVAGQCMNKNFVRLYYFAVGESIYKFWGFHSNEYEVGCH